MDFLLARHRKEQRDLQSQITQKKKSATKKTRKSVNDECAKLEEELKVRQQRELGELNNAGSEIPLEGAEEHVAQDDLLDAILKDSTEAKTSQSIFQDLHISDPNGESNVKLESTSQTSRKPNRQKARLARRAAEQEAVVAQAAEEASNLPDLRARERARMVEQFEQRGLQEKEVAANGHCMYSAIADQMRQFGLALDPDTEHEPSGKEGVQQNDYKIVRTVAAGYMEKNKDDFEPFLEEPLDEYLRKIRETGEWGGQLELLALAKAYHININVLQGDGRVEQIESGAGSARKDAWLAYYRHGFGLGEHYNSLRKVGPSASPRQT